MGTIDEVKDIVRGLREERFLNYLYPGQASPAVSLLPHLPDTQAILPGTPFILTPLTLQ